MLTIYVVSDGTSRTVEQMARAALMQFDETAVTLVQRSQIRTPQQVREVAEEASGRESMILHTLVSDELRRLMLEESRIRGVDSLDVLGPVLDRLAAHLKVSPREMPGLFGQLAEARSREIQAVEYAFSHDDGHKVDDLDRAEVVLVGVSRSMKTPTTLYMAYRGWFAANVPLVPELAPPSTLLKLPAERVFCLAPSPARLVELRRARATDESIPMEPYASPRHVREELQYAQRLCTQHGWRRIEVTGKSVEEVCREIIALLP